MPKLKTTVLPRKFKVGLQLLPDPMPSADLETVIRILSASNPEITTATMKGPVFEDDAQVWSFSDSIGTKG
jgi:PRTRC genetic system protein C